MKCLSHFRRYVKPSKDKGKPHTKKVESSNKGVVFLFDQMFDKKFLLIPNNFSSEFRGVLHSLRGVHIPPNQIQNGLERNRHRYQCRVTVFVEKGTEVSSFLGTWTKFCTC